jgi:hypothetical protein
MSLWLAQLPRVLTTLGESLVPMWLAVLRDLREGTDR